MITDEQLTKIAFWAVELSPDERARACKGITEKTITKGSYLCHRGDRVEYWMGLVSGLLRLGTITNMGKAVTMAGLPPGEWFGEGSVLKNEARRYDLLALRDSRVAMMPRATFLWLFENSVGFNRFLVRQFNERLGQFIGLVENDRALDAPARLARSIAWLFNPVLNPGAGDYLTINQEEIGLLSGLSRQAANRALQVLEKRGLLTIEHGGLRVRNLEGLATFEE